MSDYPMLISNKLHSFRNFNLQMYEIYFAFGLPVRANIRSGRAAVRRCPDRRGRGTGGTEFQVWRTCLPDFPKNDGFTRCGSGWLDRPTIGADAEGSRGFRRARRRNADQVWLVTHFSPSLT